jgi:lipopolysaccharide export system permease protein
MDKFSKYILKEFLPIFFSIFFIINAIMSLIFIVLISNITANLKITAAELLKMYLLTLPQIVFISIAISFFIASISLYAKLSDSEELIALFALGFKPLKVLKPILIISIIITLINLFLLFVSIPYSEVAFKNFKNQKKATAKFNFQSNQVSQKFGEWVVFANKKTNNYSQIFLFNPKEKKLILSKNANLHSKNNILSFSLFNVKIYDFNSSYIIQFKKMQINKKTPQVKISIFDLKNYFKYNKKTFANKLPIALLPITLFFFIPLISFYHPRLSRKKPMLTSTILVVTYIALSLLNKNLIISILISLAFLIIGGVLFKWKNKF